MAFTIGFKPVPLGDPTSLQFNDLSVITEDSETITSRVITLIKSDLSSENYSFSSDPTILTLTVNGILDKDYALEALYTVVTSVATYTKILRFVTLGYAAIAKKKRIKRFSIDSTIEDKEQYKKNTLELNYYIIVANDRVLFGDVIGAQKALDYIADIVLKDANSPFSY